jgi:hypothetical protein
VDFVEFRYNTAGDNNDGTAVLKRRLLQSGNEKGVTKAVTP